jgi:hypothetical protein
MSAFIGQGWELLIKVVTVSELSGSYMTKLLLMGREKQSASE